MKQILLIIIFIGSHFSQAQYAPKFNLGITNGEGWGLGLFSSVPLNNHFEIGLDFYLSFKKTYLNADIPRLVNPILSDPTIPFEPIRHRQYKMGSFLIYHLKPLNRFHPIFKLGLGGVQLQNYDFAISNSNVTNELNTIFNIQKGIFTTLGLGLDCKVLNALKIRSTIEYHSTLTPLQKVTDLYFSYDDNTIYDLRYSKIGYQSLVFSVALIFQIY
ncbi:MAG: hypothetical protein AB8B72_01050 [Crocinitomicaceae bacterium]